MYLYMYLIDGVRLEQGKFFHLKGQQGLEKLANDL